MSKHTPGPWSYAFHDNSIIDPQCGPFGEIRHGVVIGDEFIVIGSVGFGIASGEKKRTEAVIANAHLTASAPEMYEACFHAAAACVVCNGTGILQDAAQGWE